MSSITYDNAASGSITSSSSLTISSFALGSGSNRAVLVGIQIEDSSAPTVSSVTFNGVNMTLVDSVQILSGIYLRVLMYKMLESQLPAAGSYNIVITLGGSYSAITAGVISLSGVLQTGSVPEVTASITNTSTDTISQNITTISNGAWCVDTVGCGNAGSFAPDALQIERYDVASSTSTGAGSTRECALAGSKTIGWTYSTGANRMALLIGAFAPVFVTNIIDEISGYDGIPVNDPVYDESVLKFRRGITSA